MLKISVVGSGLMGTAISQIISKNYKKVYMYVRNKKLCDDINESHFNNVYFPNIKLNENIIAVNNLGDLKDSDMIFLCIPSSVIREFSRKLNDIVSKNCIFVSTAKGLEKNTNKRMSQIIEEETNKPIVVLSGPNIPIEMINDMFIATDIASSNVECLKLVETALKSSSFKLNFSSDVVGTEFCSVIKNVIAISQGICEGIGINNNARFALFTKSFNETKEFIKYYGGNPETVDSYCGFGDIVTSSAISVSRNHTLGILYGQKMVIDEVSSGITFEGKNVTRILKRLSDDVNFDFLTVNFVYDVMINNKNPKQAFLEFWDKI